MVDKLTPEQLRRSEEIREYVATVQHVKRLVTDLEGSRAAKQNIIQGLCDSIARELSELRQRTLSAKLGTVPDIAGAMSVMATRGGGLNTKLRGLAEGVASLMMQLDHALHAATTPVERLGGRDSGGAGRGSEGA